MIGRTGTGDGWGGANRLVSGRSKSGHRECNASAVVGLWFCPPLLGCSFSGSISQDLCLRRSRPSWSVWPQTLEGSMLKSHLFSLSRLGRYGDSSHDWACASLQVRISLAEGSVWRATGWPNPRFAAQIRGTNTPRPKNAKFSSEHRPRSRHAARCLHDRDKEQ